MFWKKWFVPKPYNKGFLPEKDGHKVYFAEFGNKNGEPVLMFHGGPGYWSRAENAANFDLKKYRVIMFDQRGAGKSEPLGRTEFNTTADLIDDASRLLDYLQIKKKLILYGGSWGSTLALLFAEKNPERVKCLLLSKIFFADADDRDWELNGSARFYPDIMDIMVENLGSREEIPQYYNEMINSGVAELQNKAAAFYGSYEMQLGSLSPKIRQEALDEKTLQMMRVFMHYSAHDFMLPEREIYQNLHYIAEIPMLIVHNRLDFVCPVANAYRLHKAVRRSRLVIVPDKGHSSRLLSETNKAEVKKFLENIGTGV